MSNESVDLKLGVYTERLDRYIESQTELNKTLTQTLNRLETELGEINEWRNKVYGVKTGVVALALLVSHTVLVIGGITGLISWLNNR